MGYFFAQSRQNGKKFRVGGESRATFELYFLILVELVVFYDFKRLRTVHEVMSGFSQAHDSVVIYVAFHVAGQLALAQYSAQIAGVGAFGATEDFKVIEVVRFNVGGCTADHHVHNLFGFKFLFNSRYCFKYGK